MAEYIEHSAVVSILRAKANMAVLMDAAPYFEKAAQMLEKLPAADVAPVVHGRWEMRPTGMATDTGPEYKAYCTVCNEPNKQYQPPFCPHCGAMMDGERKDGEDG